MRLIAFVLIAPWVGALALSTSAAHADDSGTARALFDEAKKLASSGKFEEACPKFLASLKIDPKPGTALNLADCYEKSGKTASAWSRFLEAATLAERSNQPERVEYAREHAKALEPKLSKLTVKVVGAAPDILVLRDGSALDAAAWGTAVPVDPGKHVLEATAPGRQRWTGSVDVAATGADASIEVPSLLPAPTKTVSVGDAAQLAGSGLKTAGFVALGAGVVGIGVGAAFGVTASSKWSDVKKACPLLPKCDQANAAKQSDASAAATASTIAFVAGGVAAALGVVLVVAAPKQPKPAPAVTGLVIRPGLGAIVAEGTF